MEDVEQGRLRSPSTLPELASLDISPEYLDKTHFRNPPKVEIGVDGVPRYRGEADDVDTSPQLAPAPLSSVTYHDEPHTSSSKRSKRYEPYGAGPSSPKRPRKAKSASGTQESQSGETSTQPYPPPTSQPNAGYSDPSLSATTTPHYSSFPYYTPYHPQVYPPAPYTGSVPPITTSSPLTQQTPSPTEQPQSSPSQAQPPVAYSGYTSEPPMYSYYPTPPHAYASYPAVWPQYSGYPPPSANPHPSSSASTDGVSGVASGPRVDGTRENVPGGTGG